MGTYQKIEIKQNMQVQEEIFWNEELTLVCTEEWTPGREFCQWVAQERSSLYHWLFLATVEDHLSFAENVLCCLLDLFPLLEYFSVPNLQGLKEANRDKQARLKKQLPSHSCRVPWLQLHPTAPLGNPQTPSFGAHKSFFGVFFNCCFSSTTVAIISVLCHSACGLVSHL